MYIPIEQNAIDQKIHQFMARKSPSWGLSESIAERLTPSLKAKRRSSTDIAYEQLEWHQGDAAHAKLQKAH